MLTHGTFHGKGELIANQMPLRWEGGPGYLCGPSTISGPHPWEGIRRGVLEEEM